MLRIWITKKELLLEERLINIKEYGNGCIILEPRELSVSKSISSRTLADMDRAVSNFKRGDVSSAIDLSDFSKE